MSEFPREGYEFFGELAGNNNREWFEAHKREYAKFVKNPGAEIVDELTGLVSREFGEEFGSKIYRIHRDVRFSKDKTPYNTYFRATLMPLRAGERKGCDRAALHFSIEVDEVIAGVGMFDVQGDQLARYRELVADPVSGGELVEIVDRLKAVGGRMDEPELKRVPAGFEVEGLREDLIRRKGLALWIHEPGIHAAGSVVVAADVLGMFLKVRDLYGWMQRLD